MRAKDLVLRWEGEASEALAAREYRIRLPIHAAARVAALLRLYPQYHSDQLLSDLVDLALQEVEDALPHAHDGTIVSEDDEGNPIYEESGTATRYREWVEHFERELAADAARDLVPE